MMTRLSSVYAYFDLTAHKKLNSEITKKVKKLQYWEGNGECLKQFLINNTRKQNQVVSSPCDLMDSWDISLLLKRVKRFSEQKNFFGCLMDLYSSSAQSLTKSESKCIFMLLSQSGWI